MEKVITVRGLHKSYGEIQAVSGVDLSVRKGEFFAFLGPNGAGKSTTIDILCTLIKPDEGEILVNNYKLGAQDSEIRRSIGVVFQDGMLDKDLTVAENLISRASFYGLKGSALKSAVERTIETTGAQDIVNRRYGKLSGGQRRRADIARALINTPSVLFLDEPTTGLDPQTRKEIWQAVKNLQQANGLTVFLTTHYMEEAAEADYISIINHGKITAEGTPSEIRERYSSDLLTIASNNMAELTAKLGASQIEYETNSGIVKIKLGRTFEAIDIVHEYKSLVKSFEVRSGSLDDAFINIVGGGVQ